MTLPLPPSCSAIHSASTAGMLSQSERDGVGAGLGHDLVEADDDDPGVAGLLIVGLSAESEAGVDEDGVGLLRG